MLTLLTTILFYFKILDKVEKLREREGYILPGFLSLQELVCYIKLRYHEIYIYTSVLKSGSNVSVVLLSEIPWDKYRGSTSIGFKEPLTIYFPSYTKGD